MTGTPETFGNNEVRIVEKDGGADIFLNGEKIKNAFYYSVEHKAGDIQAVTFGFYAHATIEKETT